MTGYSPSEDIITSTHAIAYLNADGLPFEEIVRTCLTRSRDGKKENSQRDTAYRKPFMSHINPPFIFEAFPAI
jgi:hypothetical protein